MTKYLPEATYIVDSELTRGNLKKGDIVTGKVEIIVKSEQFLIVNLGTFRVRMRFEDSSIYATRQSRSSYVDPNIYSLVGKTIRAKVIKVGKSIVISRKEFMKDALDYFKETNPSEFTVVITRFNKLSAFVDVGAGIHGRISPANFAMVRFKDIQDIGLKVGDFLKVKNLSYNDDLKAFELSRVATIVNKPYNFKRDEQVNFKVFEALSDGFGYLGLIDKKYHALLDSKYVKLRYGDEVIGIVKDVTSKGIKLKFEAFTYNE